MGEGGLIIFEVYRKGKYIIGVKNNCISGPLVDKNSEGLPRISPPGRFVYLLSSPKTGHPFTRNLPHPPQYSLLNLFFIFLPPPPSLHLERRKEG